jgi:REP element-mobilizing transposase RayT
MNNPFLPETFYHVYNRAIGDEKAFKEERNYLFFLQKLKQYIVPIADVYAYCLLPNHYHLLVYIKSEEKLEQHKNYLKQTSKLTGNFNSYESFILQQFSNMANSYTKAVNKQYKRKGRLLMESIQRKPIDDSFYFTKVIHYIHCNPVHHGLTKQINDWPHSSYAAFLTDMPTLLQRDKVLEWFYDKKKFIEFHQQPIDPKSKWNDK